MERPSSCALPVALMTPFNTAISERYRLRNCGGINVESELQLARDLKLPYYEVYYESLVNGIHHTHNQDLLHEIAQSQGHDVELDDWLSRNS